MNRRTFVKLAVLGSASFMGCWDVNKKKVAQINFPIIVSSNMKIGHKIMDVIKREVDEELTTKTVIVGGGIAGLAAANALNSKDFLLLEMNDDLGGTSGSIDVNGSKFSMGAHYDLAYPKYYGDEGIDLLEKTELIKYNNVNAEYQFVDKQYLIPEKNQKICITPNDKRESTIGNSLIKDDFLALLKPYIGEMPMPTRLIDKKHHHLNDLTFYQYLDKYLVHSPEFIQSIDYQMLDDYGANCSSVSALAGIHYYTCRDYYQKDKPVELFSPPEGNYYFINKFFKNLPKDQIQLNHLVYDIKKKGDYFEVKTLDHKANIIKSITCENIIYAGQKNALKFISPENYEVFEKNTYAPWVVINFEMKPEANDLYGMKWQNDMLGFDNKLLGFVDSKNQNSKQHVLTMYMCFDSNNRQEVKGLLSDATKIITEAVSYFDEFFEEKGISSYIKKAHVNLLGHAMPIPKPGYLFKDKNDGRKHDNMVFAGVDNGRLPLMFEAIDSGIVAAQFLKSS